VLLRSVTYRKPITSITDAQLPSVTYLLSLLRHIVTLKLKKHQKYQEFLSPYFTINQSLIILTFDVIYYVILTPSLSNKNTHTNKTRRTQQDTTSTTLKPSKTEYDKLICNTILWFTCGSALCATNVILDLLNTDHRRLQCFGGSCSTLQNRLECDICEKKWNRRLQKCQAASVPHCSHCI
jgi:hypothetical protein